MWLIVVEVNDIQPLRGCNKKSLLEDLGVSRLAGAIPLFAG